MAKNVNRVDHTVARVGDVAATKAATARLSQLLGIAFYTFDREETNMRVVISHDAGFELVAALKETPGATAPDGWMSVLYGVRDIEATEARLAGLGIEKTLAFNGISGVESYVERYTKFNEVLYPNATFAGLPMGFVQSEEQPDSRTAGPRRQDVNHISHMVAQIPLADLDTAVDTLSNTLQTAFYGPYDRGDGVRVAASWDAGIVLESPLDTTAEVTTGWDRMGIGVRDLDATLARLAALGVKPTLVRGELHGDEPWAERFSTFREAHFDPADFCGLRFSLTEIVEHPDQQTTL